PPASTLFPYTTLFRSERQRERERGERRGGAVDVAGQFLADDVLAGGKDGAGQGGEDSHARIVSSRLRLSRAQKVRPRMNTDETRDRKSTRLNSSHRTI